MALSDLEPAERHRQIAGACTERVRAAKRWDLARATGQDDRLDAGFCAALLAGMTPLDEILRSSGQYGPRVATPDDADAQTRLLGFIGRDPFGTSA